MNNSNHREYYEKIQAAARKQAVDADKLARRESLSFGELRQKGVAMYVAYAKDYEDMEKAVAAIQNHRDFSEIYKQEQSAKVRNVYGESINKLKKEFSSLVTSTLEATEVALNKMFTTAPTPEQLNLLQTLQLREDDLTEDEVMRIACELASNYNAIKALQKIARKAKIKLSLPEQYDSDSLMEHLTWVKAYLAERLHDFATPWSQMHPNGRAFFGSEWDDLNYNTYAVKVFDEHSPIQMQKNVTAVSVASLTDDERATLSHMFGHLKTSKDIEKAVLTAVIENETIAKLISKHDVYKNFLPSNLN